MQAGEFEPGWFLAPPSGPIRQVTLAPPSPPAISQSEVVTQSYPRVLSELGITPVDVRPDGDCFFNSVIAMWRDQLRELLHGREPTADRLRDWLANLVRDDFARAGSRYAPSFPGATTGSAGQQRAVRDRVVATIRARGSWDNDVGDMIPQIFAHRAGLPMTMVGLNTYHLGPEGAAPQNYIVYDGSHYRGARANRQVFRAVEVRPIVERIRQDMAHQLARLAGGQTDQAPGGAPASGSRPGPAPGRRPVNWNHPGSGPRPGPWPGPWPR
ncbi:MAG TPA: hypothetical protein VGI31_01755 [Streptosporangiaceae bacterium]